MKTVVYDGSSFTECLDDWDVIMEMRKAIYCVECMIPIDAEFDEKQETNSRHLIYYGMFPAIIVVALFAIFLR